MGKGFHSRVQRMLEQADIVLETVDARFVEETRNQAIERKVVEKGKKLIIVINKSDLVEKRQAEKSKRKLSKQFPTVFVSAKERSGKKKLQEAIGKEACGKKVKIAVVGYPNSGKSSIINVLKGKKAALTSRKAGFTRGEQLVRISQNILLIDLPGLIPFEERDEYKLFLVGAKNRQDLEDKQLVALKLVEFVSERNPGELEKRYGIKEAANAEQVLDEVALKRKKLLKGGKPDLEAASTIILEDWSKHKLRVK